MRHIRLITLVIGSLTALACAAAPARPSSSVAPTQAAGTPTAVPATAAPTASTAPATATASSTPTTAPPGSPSAAGCDALLTQLDVGANFAQSNLRDVDPSLLQPGSTSARQIQFRGSGANADQSISSTVVCFGTPAQAQAQYDAWTPKQNQCGNTNGVAVDLGTAVIGEKTTAVFCPESAGASPIPAQLSVVALSSNVVFTVAYNVPGLAAPTPDVIALVTTLATTLGTRIHG